MRTPQPNPPPANLAGSLLLAHPAMRDPNFRRAVVLMSVHNKEGAMGVVLNRPLGKNLGDLNGSFAYGPLSSIPVYIGGPVQTEQIIMVAWQPQADGFRLHFGLEPDKAIEMAGDGTSILRAYVGYAGWSGGQLENEMKHHTWVVSPMLPAMLELPPNTELWARILGGMGAEWMLLASEPDDPSLN